MEYLFLFITAAGVTFQNIMTKQFNTKVKVVNSYFYSSIVSFFAMIFFVISAGGKLHFTKELFPYSITCAVLFGIMLHANLKALKYGPMSITSLISSIALVVPTLFGIIVLNDPIGPLKYIGILFLVFALVMINLKKEDDKRFSPKWIIFATLLFFSNGLISIIQKVQQMAFDGEYKNEFMLCAFFIVFVLFFVMGLRVQGDKKKMLCECVKYAAPVGLANGLGNFLVLVLTAVLPTAILFPAISAVSMVLTFILALIVFREKLSKAQTIGYISGVISVVLLNI